MKTPPFFRHTYHVTGLMAAPPEPERYPYHDDDACPTGQAVKISGQWQYYEPTKIDETRARCPVCIALNKPGKPVTVATQEPTAPGAAG